MITIRTFERMSKKTTFAIDAAKCARFTFADGKVVSMPLRTRTPRIALQELAINLRNCASIDDALRETACSETLAEDMPEASLAGLIEIMDAIEQGAIDGCPDPKIRVSLNG